jgi:hypothetical protein
MNLNRIQRERTRSPQQASSSPAHAAVLADLKAYQDGELSGWRRWRTKRHVSRCTDCEKEITRLKRISEEMRSLPQPFPRPELRARILASLPDTPPQPVRSTNNRAIRPLTGRLTLAGAACVLLACLLAARLYRGAKPVSMKPIQEPILAQAQPTPIAAPPHTQIVRDTTQAGTGADIPSSTGNDTISHQPASQPAPDRYTDPTSIEANKLLAREGDELNRAVLRARQERDRLEREALHRARQQHLALSRQAGPPALQLAVADVPTAAQQVRAAVQNLGGSVDGFVGSADLSPSTRNAMAHPATDSADAGNVPEPVIAIRIPAGQAGSLHTLLSKLGALTPLKTRYAATKGHPIPLRIGSEAINPNGMNDTISMGEPRAHAQSRAVPMKAEPGFPAEYRGDGYVVYTLHLQPTRQQ